MWGVGYEQSFPFLSPFLLSSFLPNSSFFPSFSFYHSSYLSFPLSLHPSFLFIFYLSFLKHLSGPFHIHRQKHNIMLFHLSLRFTIFLTATLVSSLCQPSPLLPNRRNPRQNVIASSVVHQNCHFQYFCFPFPQAFSGILSKVILQLNLVKL